MNKTTESEMIGKSGVVWTSNDGLYRIERSLYKTKPYALYRSIVNDIFPWSKVGEYKTLNRAIATSSKVW